MNIKIENTSMYRFLNDQIGYHESQIKKATEQLEINPDSLAYKGILKNSTELLSYFKERGIELLQHNGFADGI